METARHRRSKSATALEGNFQIHKQKAVPKSVADSRSYSGGITKEDVSMFESGQNSLKRAGGTPIKKLLEQEMAKESGTRRRSPSIIARLMGLDGLPSPQHGHKQQKRLLDKHQQRNASPGIDQNEQPYEGRSSKMSTVDQQDFKDVYEDMEASHVTNHRNSSRWSANSTFTLPEMASIQHKFMDAKCLSSNKKVQVCKEFDDTIDILDSSKDLLQKYFEQPHPMFLNRFHDMQIDPYSRPLYGRKASLEQSSSAEHEGNDNTRKSARDVSYKLDFSSGQKREDRLLLQSHKHHSSCHSFKAEKSLSDVKDEADILPTKIVVLKPNLAKRVNAVTSVSSPESSRAQLPSLRKRLQHSGSDAEEILSCKKKNSSSEVCFSQPNSSEDREVAKEITKQMKEHFRRLKGYAGDESSYDVYESDSSSNSEVMTLSSRNSFDGKSRIKYSSGPYESLVSREAKKRLSERWKLIHKSQSFEPIAKGSTLGEMLSAPEKQTVQEHFGAAIGMDGVSDGFAGSSDSSGWDGTLCISSRDGWKDGCIISSSRSSSLPSSSVAIGSCKTNGRREPLFNDLVKNKKICRGRGKERKGNLSEKDKFSSKDIRSSIRASHPCHRKGNDSGLSPDLNSRLIQAHVNSCKEDQHEKDSIHFHIPHITDSFRNISTDELTNSRHESLNLSLDCSLNFHSKHLDCMKEHDDSSALGEEDANLQEPALGQSEGASVSLKCTGPESESSECSKEADHPSPVSVLEVFFAEDASSSSECFETVNAQLNDLRMQLQLLKIESGGCAGTAMLSSSNKDVMQQQPEMLYEEKSFVGGDCWETSYIVDALLCSGLEEFDSDTSFASWHSPDCPLGPWVFTDLEKKYNGKTTHLKFERRLLFDCINSALLEMFQQHEEQCPWVQPKIIGASKWQKNGVKDYLIKLLVNQERKANEETPEHRLDREMNWLGFRDDINMIGKEIEKLLINDLIGEVVA